MTSDTPTPTAMTPEQRAELVKSTKMNAAMINFGEAIPWGSETILMEQCANQLEADGVTIATITAERDAARAEIARLTAALATPDQIAALAADRAATVTVKPLVWIKHPSADIWRCDTMIGTYKVFGGMPSWDFDSATDAKDKTSHTSTSAKLAKAASQADYDARIRSAITITSGASPDTIPLPRAEVEDVADTLNLVADWMEKAVKDRRIIGPEFHVPTLRKALATLQGRMK